MKELIKRLIPPSVLAALLPRYHRALASLGAILYGHPSRRLKVVAVTGTKGKSTVTELVTAILEEHGYTVALASTIHFKIAGHTQPNKLKMTMPGRFFLQRFLRRAVLAGCEWAVIEMTSEGARQFRHLGIDMDALIFTNISPEHIESHGSFENYLAAKLSIGCALEQSCKRPRSIIANADDDHGADFLALHVDHALPFSRDDAQPYHTSETGTEITFQGTTMTSVSAGEFTIDNMLAAATFAYHVGIAPETMRRAFERTRVIPGRVEHIDEGQDFDVVVDYAHTADSLEKLYRAFPNRTKLCVLGNTGGGRDTWKRPEMGAIAEKYCERVILTDEDPYDEDPEKIVRDMVAGMQREPTIVMDRRRAIRYALTLANEDKGDLVLISGKGTDPYIMRARGTREPWSDARVAREELQRLLGKSDSAV